MYSLMPAKVWDDPRERLSKTNNVLRIVYNYTLHPDAEPEA